MATHHPACEKCELNGNCQLQEYDELWNCMDVKNFKKTDIKEDKKMDWLTELIRKDIDEGYSDAQIAKDIREELEKRLGCPLWAENCSNIFVYPRSQVDKAIGIGEK
jgi:hypothetical protein